MTLEISEGLDEDRVRVAALGAATARRLGVGVGDIVELVNLRGAPVRLWVARVEPDGRPRALVSVATLAMLGVPAGASLEIRAVTAPRRADG